MTVDKLIAFLNNLPVNTKVKICKSENFIETESEDVSEVYFLQAANSEETSVILVG